MQKKKLLPRLLPLLLGLLAVANLNAQTQTSTAPPDTGAGFNVVIFIMITIAVLLAFVILGLGVVLNTLGREALKHNGKSGKAAALLIMFSFASLSGFAQEAEPTVVAGPSQIAGITPFAFWMIVFVIFLEIVAVFFMLFMIRRMQQELPAFAEKQSSFAIWFKSLDKKLFTKAVPVEKEADILLDHSYDGIKELDNSLPPWWKYGFIVTIIFSVGYMLHFHVFGFGKDPVQEYQYEMEKAEAALLKYQEADPGKIDENNIQMADAAGIARGAEIYNTACWSCHGKQLEGGAGPNLVDDYWIHKGSMNDIYVSIKVGYPDKGMQSWEKNYSPKEISYLTSYIKSMKGSNPPNAKAPQGDLYVDEAEAPDSDNEAAAKDSAQIAAIK